MKTIKVRGGQKLDGQIKIQGSKNAFQKIISACVRWPGEFELKHVPDIEDANALIRQFAYLGGQVEQNGETTYLNSKPITPKPIGPEFSRRSRASFLFAGALVARFGEAQISLPGGDQIGPRPVNYHLDAFRSLGIKARESTGFISLSSSKIQGSFTFPEKTIGGTINALLAASGSHEVVELRNCVCDADVENAIKFMNELGNNFRIIDRRAGIIRILPSKPRSHLSFNMPPDQHVTATYAIAGALAADDLTLSNIDVGDSLSIWDWLHAVGANFELDKNAQLARIRSSSFRRYDRVVEGHIPPRFSTDWGPMVQVALTQLPGGGTFHEYAFSNRFAHIPELVAMGARARLREVGGRWVNGSEWSSLNSYDECRYDGPTVLKGSRVVANDVRSGAALVLAGLIADGETIIQQAEHIDRGYEDIAKTLRDVGAEIF